jgi:hypothetical protein
MHVRVRACSRSTTEQTATTPSGLSWAATTASTGRLVSTGHDRAASAIATIPFRLAPAGSALSQWRRSATPRLGLVSRRPRGQQADGGAVGAEAKAPTALQIRAAADKCQQRCGQDLRLPLADRRAEARRVRKSTGLPLLIERSKRRGVCGRSDRECQQAGARRRAEEPAHFVRDRAEPGSRGMSPSRWRPEPSRLGLVL